MKILSLDGLEKLVANIMSKFSKTDHTHTASEVGADASGSAAAALSLSEQYTDEKVSTLQESLTNHTTDTTVHITSAERTQWNQGEANQNAFSNVKVGETDIESSTSTDSLTLVAGDSVDVIPDVVNKKITISNAGVRNVVSGDTNGTILVDINGTNDEVPVKGLGSAAYTNSDIYATAEQGAKADISTSVKIVRWS